MSELSETSGRPSTSTIAQKQLPHGNVVQQPSSPRTKHRQASRSSNSLLSELKTAKSRRRSGDTKKVSSGPHTGASPSEQQSILSPAVMSSPLPSVHYTRTGRISKAKKGLKVHNCAKCGRSYTRAEHLRRHQKNHAEVGTLACTFASCKKTFFRLDLLQRHMERHNEAGKGSDSPTTFSPEPSPDPSLPGSVPGLVAPIPGPSTMPSTPYSYSSQPLSPAPTVAPIPSGHQKQRGPFINRQAPPMPVAIDGITSGLGGWVESFNQSPGYSSSSGYASPIPGPGDYSSSYTHPFYNHGYNRTRTSSNASFVHEPWTYPSRSPASIASTLAYTWSSSEKTPTAPGHTYLGTSYDMASMPMSACMDSMTGYEAYGTRTLSHRDDEEGVILFGDQPYGSFIPLSPSSIDLHSNL
ncbi:hypothetical protein ACN47E_007436 [Coniothyrium glycines]